MCWCSCESARRRPRSRARVPSPPGVHRRRGPKPTTTPCAGSRARGPEPPAPALLRTHPENTKRATDPRGRVFFGGTSVSTRPACERCRTIRCPPENTHTRYLARRVIDDHRLAVELLDRRRERLERGEAEQFDLLRARPSVKMARRSARACISGSSGTLAQCSHDLHARAPRVGTAEPHLAHGRELRRLPPSPSASGPLPARCRLRSRDDHR